MNALILLLLSIVPQETGMIVDRCELIEVNVCWALDSEECEKPYLSQLIFWDTREGESVIRDWRLLKKGMYPVKERDEWVVTWMDNATLRQVRAPLFRLRHTGYDVEIKEQEKFPAAWRRKLTPNH